MSNLRRYTDGQRPGVLEGSFAFRFVPWVLESVCHIIVSSDSAMEKCRQLPHALLLREIGGGTEGGERKDSKETVTGLHSARTQMGREHSKIRMQSAENRAHACIHVRQVR